MMLFVHTLLSKLLKHRLNRIKKITLFPTSTQKQELFYLLKTAQNTVWGKKYDYSSIKNIAQYQKRVPISSYEDLYPYIHRVLNGEKNVLWPGPIYFFSKSSGTTNNKSKYIPVSKQALHKSHFRGGKDMLALYFKNNPESKLFTGQSLTVSGTLKPNPYNFRTTCGDVSAVVAHQLPFWAALRSVPNARINAIYDWEEKLKQIIQTYAKTNITSFVGVPTWILVLLKQILEHTGKASIAEIWQNIEVFFHGAVSFSPYRQTLRDILGKDIRYVDIYSASEGFFGIQDQFDDDSMLLMLDYGIFYEFIPLKNIDDPKAQTLTLNEVQLDEPYAVVITTNSGLWRYAIGDTIRFTSYYPHRFKIIGRTKLFINAFGEEVIIENAENALNFACQQTQAQINEFTAAPQYLNLEERGKHEWVIEFSTMPNDLDTFVTYLDNHLKEINSDYEAKRYKDIALLPPVIKVAPQGTFYKWMKKRGKLGGQNKVPRLSNDRTLLEDLLQNMN